MKTVLKSLIAALFVAALAAPAGAQQKAWGFGVYGSRLQSGTLAQNGVNELKLDNDLAIGGNLEWWFGGRRLGFRLDAAHLDQPFVFESENLTVERDNSIRNELSQHGSTDTWLADADFMLRLLSPTVDRKFAPFISLGGGFIRWDHEGGDENLQIPELDVQIFGNAQSEFAATGSLGVDFFVGQSVALRLEAKDYWNPGSPYIKLSRLVTGEEGDRHHDGAHHMMYRAGLTFLFGGARVEEPGFISVAPEPAPAPAPAPVVAAAPTTESVRMCVVDQNGRLSMVSATRNLSNRTVYISRNGTEVPFATAYPATQPYYIKGAPWYVAARPLVLNLDEDDMGGDVDDELDDAAEKLPENRVEFVNFGSTQPLPMGDVLYVGTIDGTPLYAKRTDIGSLLPDLEAKLRTTTDLDEVLDDEAFATRFATEIETFYTVVEPGSANCVFQPMSSTRVVRRTRG